MKIEDQIKEWKRTHGENKIFQIDVETDDVKAKAYFRKPTLEILSLASKYSDDLIKTGEVLFDNCWLGGDDVFNEDDEVKFSAYVQLNSLFEIKTSTIKKL